jgi:hypothetical protein
MNTYLLCKVRILTARARIFSVLPMPTSATDTVRQILETANDLSQFCESPVLQERIIEIERLSQQQKGTNFFEEMADYSMRLFELHRDVIAVELIRRLKLFHQQLRTLVSNSEICAATSRSFSDVGSLFEALKEPLQPTPYTSELAITEEADSIIFELEKLTDHYF